MNPSPPILPARGSVTASAKSDGDRRIDCIAALLQNIRADPARDFICETTIPRVATTGDGCLDIEELLLLRLDGRSDGERDGGEREQDLRKNMGQSRYRAGRELVATSNLTWSQTCSSLSGRQN
jgi:hypothetical protein